VSPLLLRVPSFQLPPEPFRTQAPPAKVSSLFAASPKTSNSAIGTRPTAFPPPGFLSLSTVSPPSVPRAYSIPQPRLGFSVQGLLPPRSHPPSSGGNFPLVVKAKNCCQLSLAPQSTPPTSRPYSTRRCVLPKRGLAAPSVAPLLSFRLPRAFPVPAVSLVPQAIRSWHFPMKCSLARSLHWVAFSVLPTRKSACLSPGCRPAQGFEPSANFR